LEEEVMKQEVGFSLIELLIVVVIIAVIAAIAVPSLLASRRAANEANAISTLRTFVTAQSTYNATYGRYATIAELHNAGLIDSTVAGATSPFTPKSGYYFACRYVTNYERIYWNGTALPVYPGGGLRGTGTRYFYTNESGVIYYRSNGLPVVDPNTREIVQGTPLNP
jgi:type IV pilus assembly protein PilA